MKNLLIQAGTVAAFVMPLFNIPMIFRMVHRKSSDDFSMVWLIGVWICILLMLPSALVSKEVAFKVYGVMNFVFFSAVVLAAYKYRLR